MFKITIIRIDKQKYKETEYKEVDRRLYTKEELIDKYKYKQNDIQTMIDNGKIPEKRIMDNVETEGWETVERVILEQSILDLDMEKVIKAVNGID